MTGKRYTMTVVTEAQYRGLIGSKRRATHIDVDGMHPTQLSLPLAALAESTERYRDSTTPSWNRSMKFMSS